MKRILSVLLMMALVLGTMPTTYAATPVSTTFKSIGDLAGAHMISDTDQDGKEFGPYYAFLIINSKGAVTQMERAGNNILPDAVEGYPVIKPVLSKDKKSISFKLYDATTTVTKDKKGKLVFTNRFPDDTTVYPLIVRTFKDKDKAFAAMKADKNLKKMVEEMGEGEGH